MATRIKSNSQALKQRFREVYEGFFCRCFLVVSCPANFWIVGEHVVLYGGPGVKQNLPLRIYCGLSQGQLGAPFRISRDLKVFLSSKQNFETISSGDSVYSAMEKKITELFKKFYSQDLSGLEAKFFSESPPFCGLAVSAAMSSALVTALAYYFEVITKEQINSWSEFDPENSQFARSEFDQIFRLAWLLDSLTQEGIASGPVLMYRFWDQNYQCCTLIRLELHLTAADFLIISIGELNFPI